MMEMCVLDSPLSTGSYKNLTKIQKYRGGEQLVNNSVGRGLWFGKDGDPPPAGGGFGRPPLCP
jgi:hypothetical protein